MQTRSVTLQAVSKQFGGFAALQDVSLHFEPGAVHALVGQNGAGKSTCLGVLAGRISATEGTVSIGDQVYPTVMRPSIARDLGVSAIYQELTVIPAMSALDNVMLRAAESRLGFLDRRAMRRRFVELSDQLGVAIGPDVRAGDLSVADQQILELMRALSVDCNVLLMDEPTAALAPAERQALFRVVHDLRDRGVTIFLVSHHLDEVLEHADTVTVFRDGRVVERRASSAWTKDQLVVSMLGSELDALRLASGHLAGPAEPGHTAAAQSRAGLRVAGLTTRNGITDVDMFVAPGEIVGLGGLVGSGRTSLIRALSGSAHVTSGQMWIDGLRVRVPRTPREAAALGVRQLPEDRKRSGVIPEMSAADNMLLGQHQRHSRLGFVDTAGARRRVSRLAAQYSLPANMTTKRAGRLSGGNQQKLLLARAGSQASRLLLADEPTRGIDIGAKAVILETLRSLADSGIGIVLASSDLEEVAAVADRVYVMREGSVVAELGAGTGTDEDLILSHAFGLREDKHA